MIMKRRHLLQAAAVSALGVVAGRSKAQSATTNTSGWTMFGGNPASNRFYAGHDDPIHSPTVEGVIEPGESGLVDYATSNSFNITVDGGRAYVFGGIGGFGAIDIQSNTIEWYLSDIETPPVTDLSPTTRMPAIGEQYAVVPRSETGFYRIDLQAGEVVYEFTNPDSSEMWINSNLSSPKVYQGNIYFKIEDRLFSFDLSTGSKNWSTEIGNQCLGSVAISDNKLIYDSRSGPKVRDTETGNLLWSYERNIREQNYEYTIRNWENLGFGNPVVSDDTAIIPTWRQGIVALALSDGQERWRWGSDAIGVGDMDTISEWNTELAVSNDTVFTSGYITDSPVTEESEPSLLAIDLETGELRWEVASNGGLSFVGEDAVYCNTEQGVQVLDWETGEEIGTYSADVDIEGVVPYTDGLVVWTRNGSPPIRFLTASDPTATSVPTADFEQQADENPTVNSSSGGNENQSFFEFLGGTGSGLGLLGGGLLVGLGLAAYRLFTDDDGDD